MARVLVIEDDATIADFIGRGLSENGFVVETSATARDGEARARTGGADVVVLDVMLPDASGVDLCRRLRAAGVAVPILMLTALSATSDKVVGLESGADDYLVKPFEFAELLARLRALLRRGKASEGARLRFGGIEMDLVRREVKRDGRPIKLTAKEFGLLEFLLRNPERVLSKAEIGQQVWNLDLTYGSNVIEVYMSALRRKLDRDFTPHVLHTVIGFGYLLSTQPPPS
ncbi:MAG: response regulator transcription factor [Planctomycetota bacterium]